MCFGGLLGVAAGSIIARVWTKGYLCDRLYPLYEFICYYFRELFRFEQPGWHNHPPNQPEPDPDVPTGLAINILANPRADPVKTKFYYRKFRK
jgi:hypothetical protein